MMVESRGLVRWGAAEAPEREELDPVQRLMLAVLEDAVMTFQHGLGAACPRRRRQFHEVERWLRSRDQDSPFAFESICSALDLDAGRIRGALLGVMRDKLRNPTRRPAVRIRRTAVVCASAGPEVVARAR